MKTTTLATGETLTFDEGPHLYLCNNKPMPGTHALMERHGIVKPLDQYGAPYAERGKRIHFITEAWDESDLDYDDVDSTDKPFLDGWQRFCEENHAHWDAIEVLRGSVNYWYATVIDRVGRVGNKHTVVNIKTTSNFEYIEKSHKAHAVQLALESILEGTPHMLAVYLDPNGDYRMKWFEDDNAFNLACSIAQANGAAHHYMTKRRKSVKV